MNELVFANSFPIPTYMHAQSSEVCMHGVIALSQSRIQVQSDLTHPCTSVLDEIADKVRELDK